MGRKISFAAATSKRIRQAAHSFFIFLRRVKWSLSFFMSNKEDESVCLIEQMSGEPNIEDVIDIGVVHIRHIRNVLRLRSIVSNPRIHPTLREAAGKIEVGLFARGDREIMMTDILKVIESTPRLALSAESAILKRDIILFGG